VLRSGGILFFAFAGYARIATLGEEVVTPERTIPRAIALALAITVSVYTVIAVVALLAAPPSFLAATQAPLRAVVKAGTLDALAPAVQIGAAVASLSVLVSLLAGVSRTVFAMAAHGHLPHGLAAVHERRHVPHRALVLVGAVVATAASVTDIRGAIGFSAFCVLFYYAIANVSALTLGRRVVPAVGVVGCLALAFALPTTSVIAGAATIAAAAFLYPFTRPTRA
jgi:APA family basic amino acid/polyamine antiporter